MMQQETVKETTAIVMPTTQNNEENTQCGTWKRDFTEENSAIKCMHIRKSW
jgi:hypothetical protein